ncbi:hypothetical protein ACVWZ4_007403 [Bradyrhizobium sp. USDA 4472]
MKSVTESHNRAAEFVRLVHEAQQHSLKRRYADLAFRYHLLSEERV